MNVLFLRFSVYVVLLSALVFFAERFLVEYYNLNLHVTPEKVALFHLGLSLGVMFPIYLTNLISAKYTAFAFLATSLIRMFAVIAFVIPLSRVAEKTPIVEVLFLLIPYIVYMIIEAVFTIKLMRLSHKS
ncbi:hypothetical protein [Capnocytophaga canimorsus]|uniref:Uncharacterized protein n=1 Tax=Capnocytophaga canimorsus TaxID=28188 RepID=A0A0B7HLM9_9FLAO|nr:hypothetical protein [Capnocytophaga canimorsus]ATA77494.1 hypothetical protein CGC47_07875 [Capnocytophaga canimorsus]PJI82471.1 hypothetical protein CLV61_0939 [Capnocytophaga canimorsus]CEN38762.1 conserved membrane hypothetical protein [Capnocytophaga canimorsus]STA72761.1 Uncharacterised protein [Capnocytophaga canimorsus]GIM57628.1 hypothetical protein CAPN006_20200 [Capnocytophaga canimorsus]